MLGVVAKRGNPAVIHEYVETKRYLVLGNCCGQVGDSQVWYYSVNIHVAYFMSAKHDHSKLFVPHDKA